MCRIELFQYLGYNGSFARERKLLWKCEIVGADGTRRNSDPNSWHGHPEKQYPMRDAVRWSQFTGWPIVNLKRVEERDDKPKR